MHITCKSTHIDLRTRKSLAQNDAAPCPTRIFAPLHVYTYIYNKIAHPEPLAQHDVALLGALRGGVVVVHQLEREAEAVFVLFFGEGGEYTSAVCGSIGVGVFRRTHLYTPTFKKIHKTDTHTPIYIYTPVSCHLQIASLEADPLRGLAQVEGVVVPLLVVAPHHAHHQVHAVRAAVAVGRLRQSIMGLCVM